MASDFSVVFGNNRHFGDQTGLFDNEDDAAQFVGRHESFAFDAPGVDSNQPGIVQCRSFQVSFRRNAVRVNGVELPFALTASIEREWKAQIAVIPAGTLKASGNTLEIESRTRMGETDGNLDDFLIGSAVVTYRT